MTASPCLTIEAVVHETERPALVAASRQLAELLLSASGVAYPVALQFGESLPSITLGADRTIAVASMLVEIPGREESPERTAARWRDQLAPLQDPPFLCTIFRHVANRGNPALIE
ncbi:MAG TPA: hypothetical protein VKU84_16055, partial [Stellaceae bacterium]|nr:hypothetical protein [Stellaceae bacterium]